MATTSATPRPSRFPLWAKIAIGIVVVLAIIVLALPHFLNVDRYRATIADALTKQTGRKVTLGPIRAELLPGIGVTLDQLQISNPPDFPAGNVVSADQIRVNVALAPLLHGVIHVNSVDLVRPKVVLLTDSRGKNNYTFPSSPPSEPQNTASTAGSSSAMSLDQIDAINLTEAEILVGSVQGGGVAPLTDTKGINLTLHNFVITPMRVHDWQGQSDLSGVTVALSGWKEPISFRTGKFTLSGGKLDAQFVADLATAADIKGTMSVPDIEHPQADVEMSSSQLDIDKLMAVAGSGPSVASPAASSKPVTEPPTDSNRAAVRQVSAKGEKSPAAAAPALAAKSELLAQGHINVEKIVSAPYSVGPANVQMRVFTDRAELWPVSIGMYGGTLQLSSRVDRVTTPARFTANVQMNNVDVAKVLDVTPAARGKMSGLAELKLQLLGNLDPDWKKALSGTGSFAIRNGHLPGVNLAGAAQSLAKMGGVGQDTPFTVVQGDLTIGNQQVTSKQIHLDSSAGIVDLRGSLGLDGALNYQGVATVNPAGALGSGAVGTIVGGLIGTKVGKITVPFALGGTVQNPKVQPGKGMPSFGAPPSNPGTTTTQPSVPTTPQGAVDTLKNLFNKKK